MNETCIYHTNLALEIREKLSISHIINSISSILPGSLCAIDENSEKSFYEYVKLSSIDRSAFSYNWPYIVQATRRHGFYYQNKKSIVYFYFRKNLIDFQFYTLIIVNHLGSGSEALVCEMTEAAKKLNISSIIKNIDRDKLLLWNNLGFTETIEPWSHYSLRDDNTFPEFVYDINKFVNLEFSSRTKTIINKFSKEKKYVFTPFDNSFKNDGLKLLEKNSEYLENKGVDFKKQVILAHQFVFDDSIRNKMVFAILENDRLIAVSFLTQVEENLFFNAIINENQSNLMRFLLWKSVVHYCEGLDENKRPLYLALQGSENEGQSKWKTFFHPIRAIYRTHITNKHQLMSPFDFTKA